VVFEICRKSGKIWFSQKKKQGICGEIFPFHFYFLHLYQISGTKYGGLETGVFLFKLSQMWQKFPKQ
jgi:hypothetical protein